MIFQCIDQRCGGERELCWALENRSEGQGSGILSFPVLCTQGAALRGCYSWKAGLLYRAAAAQLVQTPQGHFRYPIHSHSHSLMHPYSYLLDAGLHLLQKSLGGAVHSTCLPLLPHRYAIGYRAAPAHLPWLGCTGLPLPWKKRRSYISAPSKLAPSCPTIAPTVLSLPSLVSGLDPPPTTSPIPSATQPGPYSAEPKNCLETLQQNLLGWEERRSYRCSSQKGSEQCSHLDTRWCCSTFSVQPQNLPWM